MVCKQSEFCHPIGARRAFAGSYGDSAGEKPSFRANPDQSCKANRRRCHVEPGNSPARELATVMRHMRVRANLTEVETKTVLYYLR